MAHGINVTMSHLKANPLNVILNQLLWYSSSVVPEMPMYARQGAVCFIFVNDQSCKAQIGERVCRSLVAQRAYVYSPPEDKTDPDYC